MTAGFSPAMQEWARRQGERLADCFVSDDVCERGDPAAYFEAAAAKHRLLSILRQEAEPAFLELEIAAPQTFGSDLDGRWIGVAVHKLSLSDALLDGEGS